MKRRWLLVLMLALLPLVSWADYLTGPDVGFAAVYLVPVMVMAWFGSRRDAFVITFAAAMAAFIADRFLRPASPLASLWNASATLAIGASLSIFARRFREETAQTKVLALRFEQLLRSVGEGIFGLDVQGDITFLNPAGAGMLRYEPEELLGKQMHIVAHYAHSDGRPYPWQECPIHRTLKEGTFQASDREVFWRRDGASFPVDLTSNPIYDANGEVTGCVVSFRDITERRDVERMKAEFVSTVSHELRTPLTSIRGSLGLLGAGLLGAVNEKGQRMLSIAISNTDRLIRLINDILDIERLESGRAPIQRTHLNAASLLQESADVMRAAAAKGGLVLEIAGGDRDVAGDHDRLIQTLTNLIGNAIKFSPQGSTITVSAEPRQDMMLFSVRDRGRGIPADQLESIFERFQQVDASDAREKGGTGLGLPISRTIVDQHGGRIWAESEPGEGSTFHFTIPLAERAIPAEEETPRPSLPPVLVCDDDPSIRAILKEMLEGRGYSIITADRGEIAVELAKKLRPCAIILDLLMERGASGWETIALLREHEETRSIPIIVASVLSPIEAAEKERIDQETLAGWLQKPLDENVLFDSLERIAGDACSPPRVLIVEDDAELAGVLRAAFAKHGLAVFHAATGTDAIELASTVRPDLVILDVVLPQMSGYSVVKWLRKDPELSAIPLVVYSSAEISPEERAQLELGPTEFLIKSRIGPEEFERRVLDLLHAITTR